MNEMSAGAALEASEPSALRPLVERFPGAVLHHEVVAGDEHVIYVDPPRILELLGWLKREPDHHYDYLSDLTAVDYGGDRPLQVVYQLYSIPHRRALRLKAELPLSDLVIDSAVPLWGAADWLEREVYDMFGITFRGHPDLRRILMPDDYAEGHPLRKDFPLRGRFSREEQTRRALAGEPEDDYIPAEIEIAKKARPVPWQGTEERGSSPGRGDPRP